ncbi:hypothetical protein [Leifsonia aquatica]|uniref:hypothetical protein n=1 Tax=Leifsonia aquatica TaxID=144185 RepID=UPI00381A8231
MATDPLRGYTHICTYKFTDPDGAYLFGKQRWEVLDPLSGLRSKTFRYWDPAERRHRKPPGADRWLYRLHEVLPAIANKRPIHWAEGEKDADALAAAGVCATSHHQGAGRVTLEQAAWLQEASAVVLWVDLDRDRWEVGAYDAVRRFNLLMEVDVDPARVRFVRARRGKDAFDHLAAGFAVSRAVPVDKYRLAEVASAFTPSAGKAAGYRRG